MHLLLTILHVLLCVVVSICHGHVTIDHWVGWDSWRVVCVPSCTKREGQCDKTVQ